MNTETKKLDKCQVQLTVKLDAEEMKKIVKDVEKAFVREVKVPGFRPGKVPVELIRKDFAQGLRAETEKMMCRRNIAEAIKAAALDSVGVADVKDVKYGADGGEFTAIVEVKPVFKLPTYKGLKISRNDTTLKEEDVQAQIERLRIAHGKFEDAKDGDLVAEGDYVQIDYDGTADGKPIAEIAPEAKIVASGKGFWLQVEEGRFLPEILEALKGMKVGETKEGVKAKFDKEAAPEPLKGVEAQYSLAVKALRRRILPDDAELAKLAKAESFEALVADMRKKMQAHADAQEAARRQDEVMNMLLKKCDFDVPGIQVRNASDRYLMELAQRAQQTGLDASYFDKNRDRIKKDADEAAERQVRMWYIVEAIAKQEKIEADEDSLGQKVIEFILANAK